MPGYLEHTVIDGERWDHLAARYYGLGTLWRGIAEANPHLPLAPFLPPGAKVAIPIIAADAGTEALELPPWRRP